MDSIHQSNRNGKATVTLGAGNRRPVGRRQQIERSPEAVAKLHNGAEPALEAWWTFGVYDDDYRKTENWRGASGILNDGDRKGADGKKLAMDDECRSVFMREVNEGTCPFNFAHLTAHGLRAGDLFTCDITDADEYARVAAAEVALLKAWLERSGLAALGIRADAGCTGDRARFMYRPNVIKDGLTVRETVYVVNAEASNPEDIVAAAFGDEPHEVGTPSPLDDLPVSDPLPVSLTASVNWADLFRKANERLQGEYPIPKSGGRCPFCPEGHGEESFGVGDQPWKWCCFSSEHPSGYGGFSQAGAAPCHHGDVLDWHLWKTLKRWPTAEDRVDHLRNFGLIPSRGTIPKTDANGKPVDPAAWLSELWAAEQIGDEVAGRLLYCPEWKEWLAYVQRSGLWERGADGVALEAAKAVARCLYAQAEARLAKAMDSLNEASVALKEASEDGTE